MSNSNWNATVATVERATKQVVVADGDRPPPNAPPMPDSLRMKLAAHLAELEEAIERIRRAAAIPQIFPGRDIGFETAHRKMRLAAFTGLEWGRVIYVASTAPLRGSAALTQASGWFERAVDALAEVPPI